MKTIYSFIGLPASGKDTQAKLLAQENHLPITGIGDLVRKMKDTESSDPEIVEAKKRYNAGDPLTDEMAVRLLGNFLKTTETDVIVTNFPLTLNQAHFLDKLILGNNWSGPILFYVKITPETAIKRATTRKICSSCGEIFPNFPEDICTKCGGKLISRADDSEEVARNRVNQWLPNVTAVADYYTSKGQTFEIDGEKSIEEVSREINKKLKNKIS
jgi:adenylate kinase